MNEIIQQIEDPELLSQIEKVVPFHGYLSTGAFIGIQMLNIAKNDLDLQDGERMYVTCETVNCIPDPFQILGGATIGNKGLTVKDHGKMAVVDNKQAASGEAVHGIRIYLDPAKTVNYPKLHSWYMNTEKLPHKEVIPELVKAGTFVYTCEMVDVEVPVKPAKCVNLCAMCGESFIQRGEESLCSTCIAEVR
jgi:formylmethanofuran dehydrogenase subunit E